MRSVSRGPMAALLGGAGAVLVSASAMAADIGGMKDEPVVPYMPDHSIVVTGGFTTDYVFRGVSQSDNDPSATAGIELSRDMFYAGITGTSVADPISSSGVEFDFYGGIRKSYNGVAFDLGLIYYTYPGNNAPTDLEFLEVKAAASAKLWRDITLTGTVYFSPDWYGESDETWTFEAKAAMPFPFWGLTLSGTIGHVTNDQDAGAFFASFGDDNYTYWNVGLSKSFREHFTVDVRYWGTDVDVDAGAPGAAYLNGIADDRIVGTLTFTY